MIRQIISCLFLKPILPQVYTYIEPIQLKSSAQSAIFKRYNVNASIYLPVVPTKSEPKCRIHEAGGVMIERTRY